MVGTEGAVKKGARAPQLIQVPNCPPACFGKEVPAAASVPPPS